MKELEKYVAVKQVNNPEVQIMYLDYSHTSPIQQTVGMTYYIVNSKLKKINNLNIRKLLIDKIVELSRKNADETKKLSLKNNKKKIQFFINIASNIIAIGRQVRSSQHNVNFTL